MGLDSWTNELMCIISILFGFFAGAVAVSLVSINRLDEDESR